MQQGFVVTLTETMTVEFDFDWSWDPRCHRFILGSSEAYREDKVNIFKRTQARKNGDVFTAWRPPVRSKKTFYLQMWNDICKGDGEVVLEIRLRDREG